MNTRLLLLFAVLASSLLGEKTLDIYTLDADGGKAVLVISPSGESMLIDVGWPKSTNREATTGLLVKSAKAAGLKRIDYLVISHYDVDHIGDVPAFIARFPVLHVVDHGPPITSGKSVEERYRKYSEVFPGVKHIVVKPGDRIPLRGVNVQVLTAAGDRIRKPLKGGGQFVPSCSNTAQKPALPEDGEDDASIGLLFTLGRFRMVDLADLEANKSYDLACPANLIGKVDVYQVNVHGQFKGITPVLLDALRPRVAVMGNGARKGGDPQTWPVLRNTPGLEDIWQSHFSLAGGTQNNPPADFIANMDPVGQRKAIKISAHRDGSFSVSTTPDGFSKNYKAERQKK